MFDYIAEVLSSTHITTSTVVGRLLLGLILGLFIGGERQMHRHDAGLRTFTLICMGSTAAVIISIWIPQAYPDMLNGDPGRIAAQVLAGGGFLGAGAIVKSKGGIQGLTSAACIWQTSIVGMTAGAGLYIGAILMTLFTLFVLSTMERIERWLGIDGENLILTVETTEAVPDIDRLRSVVLATGASLRESSVESNLTTNRSSVTFRMTVGCKIQKGDIIRALAEVESVTNVNIIA